jgi:uncharacterized membrane protein
MKTKITLMLLSLVAVAVSESLATTKAKAGEVCNYRNQVLALAQAYVNQSEVWVSEGWWLVNPGDCIAYPDNVLTYLQFNENSQPSRPYQKEPTGASEEVLEARLCVVQDRFTAFSASTPRACTEAGGKLRQFLGFGAKQELIK